MNKFLIVFTIIGIFFVNIEVFNASELQSEDLLDSNKNEIVNEEQDTNEVISEEQDTNEVISEESDTNEVISEESDTNEVISEEPDTNEVISEEPDTNEVISEEPDTNEVISEKPDTNEVISEEPDTNEVISEKPDTNEVISEESDTNEVIKDSFSSEKIEFEFVNSNSKKSMGTNEQYNIQSQSKTKSGELSLKVKNLSNGIYYLDEENNIVNDVDSSSRIEIKNGKIIDMDKGVVRTNGGKNNVINIYRSIDDASNNINAVSLSGAGYDGIFSKIIKSDSNIYVEFHISGGTFYVDINNVDLIPINFLKALSHYENVNGEWVYFSAIDSLTSTEYDSYPIGAAPQWSIEGTMYFTTNEIDFYTQNSILNKASASQATNYFQNLPFRSSSKYTGSDFKKYLKSIGVEKSKYYNDTNAFVDAQNLESINSLLLFAFANHESAYGQSTYSYRCNNFFGRGAFDSNPDNACIEYGFNTSKDGILSQAIFLQSSYFDTLDWRYGGTHFGNKASGMNVYYATDPDWGKKNASHAYQIDKFLGSKEALKFKIVKVTKSNVAYSDGGLKNPLKIESDSGLVSNYNTKAIAGTGLNSGANYVVRNTNSNNYEIQLPTALNKTNTNTCTLRPAKKGSYPNYNSSFKYTIDKNVGSFACKYDGGFASQIGFISKANTSVVNSGTSSKPENSTPPINNGSLKQINEYYPNKKLKFAFYVDNSGYIKYTKSFDVNGKFNIAYEYLPKTKYDSKNGTHGNKIQTKFFMKNNFINYACSSGGSVCYEYLPKTAYDGVKGKHYDKLAFRFYTINNYLNYAETKDRNIYYEYLPKTKFDGLNKTHGKKIMFRFFNKNGYINYSESYNKKIIYEYNSKTKYDPIKKSHANKIMFRFYIKNNYINYSENKNRTSFYEYKPRTKFDANKSHGKKISFKFFTKTNKVLIKAESNSKIYYYKKNTKYDPINKTHGKKISKIIYK